MEEYFFWVSLYSLLIVIIILNYLGLKVVTNKKTEPDISKPGSDSPTTQMRIYLNAASLFLFIGLISQILMIPIIVHHFQEFHPLSFGTLPDGLLIFFIVVLPLFLLLSSGFLKFYFKYVPSFRQKYLLTVVLSLSVLLIINIVLETYYYLDARSMMILPKLLADDIRISANGLWKETLQTLSIPFISFIFLYFTNKNFRKAHSKRSLNLYAFIFCAFLIIVFAYGYNLYLQYFNDPVQFHYLKLFSTDYYYSGIFSLFVLVLFIVTFVYVFSIYHTQKYLLARPLSGIYILKLARLNLLSGFVIVLFLVLPWLIKQYFILTQ